MIERKRMVERLNQIRENEGYETKSEFASALGVSAQVLSNAERRKGSGGFPKSILTGVAMLGYNNQWLLYGIGSMHTEFLVQKIKDQKQQLLQQLLEGSSTEFLHQLQEHIQHQLQRRQ